MIVSVKTPKQLGQLARFVRRNQDLDQVTAGLLSGNGSTFMSEFENGKSTVELGRVLNLLDSLGINLSLDIPLDEADLSKKQKALLDFILHGEDGQ